MCVFFFIKHSNFTIGEEFGVSVIVDIFDAFFADNTWWSDIAVIANTIMFNHTDGIPPFFLGEDGDCWFFGEPTSSVTLNDFRTSCRGHDKISVVF